MGNDKAEYDVPANVKIEFHSLAKIAFRFEGQKDSLERRMYELVRRRLQATGQASKDENGEATTNKPDC